MLQKRTGGDRSSINTAAGFTRCPAHERRTPCPSPAVMAWMACLPVSQASRSGRGAAARGTGDQFGRTVFHLLHISL